MVEITLNNSPEVDADKAVSEYLTTPKVERPPASQMRIAVANGMDENPDQTAELKKVAERTGVPMSSLKDPKNKQRVEKQEALSTFDFEAYTAAFPDSARFLATPEIASIAHDDVDTIGAVETVVKKLGNATRATGAGVVGFGAGTIGVARESMLLLGEGYGDTLQGNKYTAMGQALGLGQQGGNNLRDDILAPALEGAGTIESGVYSGISSLSSQAPGLIASVVTKNPAFSLTNAAVVSGGTAAGEALDQGLDPVAAGLFGLRDAAIEVGTELIPINRFIGDITGGSGFFKTLRNQILTEIPGELTATTLQNLNEWATLNPDEPFQTYLDQLPGDLAQTLVATITAVGLQTGAVQLSSRTIQRLQNRMGEAEGAINEAQSLEELVGLAQASKTLQRDAESFETWIESVAEDRDVTDIYIDPDELAQSGIDIDALTEVSPSVAKQRDAVPTGSLLKIPVSEFAANIAPTELGQSLIEVAKTDPHSMSKREAEEFMQNGLQNLEEEVEQELDQAVQDQEKAAPRKNVEQNVLTQLNDANRFTEDVNKPYAALIGNFYETLGERTGQTAEELFIQYPLNIQAQSVEGQAVLNQEVLETPEFKNFFKDSKVVDGAGDPRVVYHGTDTDFDTFDIDRSIGGQYWFTTDRAAIEKGEVGAQRRGVVKEVFLSLQNPAGWAEYDKYGIDELIGLGYDGLELNDQGQTVYVAFEPEQIKDVRNSGAFNPDDPNMFNQERRGSFNPSTSTISLLQAADLSTFLHEAGHFFLETLGSIATQPDAPQQVKDDMNTALKWMKVEDLSTWQGMDIEQQRDAHEQFARGFEAYLFEGKAPSVELQGIFQRFRSWLVNIYRELRNLNVELNDEIRSVFDRMLASDNMIVEAEIMRGMRPMFDNAEDAGMSEQEWISYQELGAEATADAVQDLDSRTLRDMKWLSNAKAREIKRLQKDARDKRKTIRGDVETEVMSEPVNQAHRFITRGEYMIPDQANKRQRRLATEIATGEGSTKMSLQSLKEFYGEEDTIWQDLPKGRYGLVAKDGMDFEQIADLFGYTSGDQMLQELINREDPKAKIEGLTDQRMLEQYGDISDPEALERAADAAVHNDARTKFVAAEMNALQKATGSRKILASAAKQLAETMINRLRIRDVKPSRYTAAEAKAARAADAARKKGDLQEAAVQKRNQLVQMYAAKSAIAAREQNEKDLRYLKKFEREGSRKTIDNEYLDQIDAILERFDLKKSTTLREIDKRSSLAEWLEAQADIGIEPDISPEISNIAFRKHFKDMSVEEMRGVVDTVKQIEHLGRLKNKLLTLKDKRQFNAVVDELVQSIGENYKGKPRDNVTRATQGNHVKRLFSGFLAEHRKVASLAREMDGVEDGGQMWEVFIRTMNEAGDREAKMREEATIKLAKVSKDVRALGKMRGKGTYFESLGRSLNREERLAIVLNMGNEGNLQRLLDGKGWTLEQVQTVLDSMTPQEFDFVQEVWDVFESYRPQIGAKEKRIYGKEPEWVEPRPLETPYGELRGGYYPIKYDTRQNAQAAQNDAAEVAKQQLRGAYTSTTTRRSFTKSRADEVVERPLLITMDALYGGLNEVVHDLAWHEWLIDANRLLRSKRLSKAILETQGADNFKQFTDAVADIAAGEMAWSGSFEKVSAHLRQGATIAGLGLSISTAMINVTGFSQSIVRVGPRWAMQGVSEWIRDPVAITKNIQDKSTFMRLRAKTMMREINEVQNLLQDKPTWRQIMDTAAYTPLTVTQMVVDTPTWWGAYQKALANDEGENRAVALADQAVVDAQGGGQVKDLARIQRSKVGKLFTVFYSYFSTTYQLTVEQTSKTNFKDPMDVLRLANDYFLIYAVPAFLGSLIRSVIYGEDDWDEPEKLAKAYANEQLSFLMAPLVGLREFSPAVQKLFGTSEYNFSYGGPASLRFFNEGDRFAQQLGQGEIDKALIRAGINFAGVGMHLPSAQINRTLDGILAIADGETQNPASLVFGPPK